MTTPTSAPALRPFGTTGLELSAVGFGAWAVGGGGWSFGWGSQDDDASVAAGPGQVICHPLILLGQPSQNKWLKPLVSKARAIDEDAPTPFENEVGEMLPKTDNYHLRVDTVGKEFVRIQLIKTHTPEPPLEEHVLVKTPGIRFAGFFGRGFFLFPTVTDKIIKDYGLDKILTDASTNDVEQTSHAEEAGQADSGRR